MVHEGLVPLLGAVPGEAAVIELTLHAQHASAGPRLLFETKKENVRTDLPWQEMILVPGLDFSYLHRFRALRLEIVD